MDWLAQTPPWVATLTSFVALTLSTVNLVTNVARGVYRFLRHLQRRSRRRHLEHALQELATSLNAYDETWVPLEIEDDVLHLGAEKGLLVWCYDEGRRMARLAHRGDRR